jgi:hypothetical protein
MLLRGTRARYRNESSTYMLLSYIDHYLLGLLKGPADDADRTENLNARLRYFRPARASSILAREPKQVTCVKYTQTTIISCTHEPRPYTCVVL